VEQRIVTARTVWALGQIVTSPTTGRPTRVVRVGECPLTGVPAYVLEEPHDWSHTQTQSMR
jgi:hypothetical protein